MEDFFPPSPVLYCPDQAGLGKFISISSALGRHNCVSLLCVLHSFWVQWVCGTCGLCTAYRCLGHCDGGVVW